MHLMYLKILLHKGALCYSVTKGHSLKEVQYLCTVYANKHFLKIPAIEPKQEIENQNEIVLFIFVL